MICFEWTGKASGTNRRLETNRYGTIYLNPSYRAFKRGLILLLRNYNRSRPPLAGPVSVHLDLKISSLRDIDSLAKPVLDCLQKARIINNDRQITRLFITKENKRRRELDRIRVLVDGIAEEK